MIADQKVAMILPDLTFGIVKKEAKPEGGFHYVVGFEHLIIYVKLTAWDRQGNEYIEESWWTYKLGMPFISAAFEHHIKAVEPFRDAVLSQIKGQ
jgi:hypothetical protein